MYFIKLWKHPYIQNPVHDTKHGDRIAPPSFLSLPLVSLTNQKPVRLQLSPVQTKDSPCNGLQRDGFRTSQGRCERVVASRCKPLQGVARRCKESPEIEHVKSQGPVLERGDLTIPLQPITAQNNLYVTALLRPGTVLSYFVDVFALLILLNSTTNNCVQIQIWGRQMTWKDLVGVCLIFPAFTVWAQNSTVR